MYQITRMSGDPAVQSDKWCRLSMISRIIYIIQYVTVKFKRNSVSRTAANSAVFLE